MFENLESNSNLNVFQAQLSSQLGFTLTNRILSEKMDEINWNQMTWNLSLNDLLIR